MNEFYVNILVKSPRRDHNIRIKKSDCIFKINELIGNEENVPSFRVRTSYRGKVLAKDKTIEHLAFSSETTLSAEFLSIEKEINVFIKITDETISRYVPLTIDNTCTLHELKKRIEKLEGIKPCNQSLCYCGQKFISDSISLFETGIQDGGVINLTVSSSSRPSLWPNIDLNKSDFFVDIPGETLTVKCPKNYVQLIFSIDISEENHLAFQNIIRSVTEIHQRLTKEMFFVEIALMFYGHFRGCKNHVFSTSKFYTDTNSLLDEHECPINTSKTEESKYEWLIHKANSLNWSDDAHKILVVVGDCEPHLPSLTQQNINWHSELDILNQRGIAVLCGLSENFSGSIVDGFYPELCKKTNGFLIKQDNLFFEITNLFTRRRKEVCERNETPFLDKRKMHEKEQRQTDEVFDENNNELETSVKSNGHTKNTKLDEQSPQHMSFVENESFKKNNSKCVGLKHRSKESCVVM